MFACSKLAIAYGLFALLATLANFAAQESVLYIYPGPQGMVVALVMGTVLGLVLKYLLDKRYIFRFVARGYLHDTQTFMLYAIMGLLTTLVFWTMELGFNYLFASPQMRYCGGAIGLLIGYLIKYQLDKRYVFLERVR